jgi:hypothetical protein
MVIRKQQSIIKIYYMGLPRLHLQKTLIGGNSRIIRRKDMEQKSGLMERDTLGSTCRATCTGMEYTDTKTEMYIKDNGNKIRKKVMHMPGGQMEMSIMDNIRIIRCTEMESDKREAYYIQLNMNKATLSAK